MGEKEAHGLTACLAVADRSNVGALSRRTARRGIVRLGPTGQVSGAGRREESALEAIPEETRGKAPHEHAEPRPQTPTVETKCRLKRDIRHKYTSAIAGETE